MGHAPCAAIREASGAELVTIAARSDSSQAAARGDYAGCDVVADYRRLLDRDDIDVVDIVVPTHMHHEIACAALDAGKHVLLENL